MREKAVIVWIIGVLILRYYNGEKDSATVFFFAFSLLFWSMTVLIDLPYEAAD